MKPQFVITALIAAVVVQTLRIETAVQPQLTLRPIKTPAAVIAVQTNNNGQEATHQRFVF